MDIENLQIEKDCEKEINQPTFSTSYVISKQYEYDLNKQVRKRLQKCRKCFYFNQQIMDTSIYRQKQCQICQQSFHIPFLFKQIVCSVCLKKNDVCAECNQPLD